MTIKAQPNPPAVVDRFFCMGDMIGDLVEGIPNVLWFESAAGGIGRSLQPFINANNIGSITFWVSQTIDGCESERSPITVTINPIPPAPSVHSPEYCVGDEVSPLVVSGVNLTWFTAQGGTGSSTPPIITTDTASVTQYWVTQTMNGCQSGHALLTVTVTDIPNSPTTTDVSYCLDDTPELLTAMGNSLQWYTCLLYTSPSPRDATLSRMPSSA